jgi:micrococcal nuclease
MKYKLLSLLLLSAVTIFAKPAKVLRVIDGDTFVIETGERVRVLGINAPEMETFYGEPAKEHLLAIIDGKTVDLEPDHISDNKDVYGRLLRYVYLDGIDIDKKMVTDGYAVAFLKFPFDKEEEYKKEELKARAASLGIWKKDANGNPAGGDNSNSRPLTSPASFIIGCICFAFILGFFAITARHKK